VSASDEKREERGESFTVKLKGAAWGAVPEPLVEDPRLSHAAVRLGVWLCIRPPGWKVRPGHVMGQLRFGKDLYQRARRELIDAGYLVIEVARAERGRFGETVWEFDRCPTNAAGAGITGAGKAGAGDPGAGEPGHLIRTSRTRTLIKRTLKSAGTGVRAGARADVRGDAAARTSAELEREAARKITPPSAARRAEMARARAGVIEKTQAETSDAP